MSLRVMKQQESALILAEWLSKIPTITKVYYSGLSSHPDYDIHMSQASGGGAVVSFETGNYEVCILDYCYS